MFNNLLNQAFNMIPPQEFVFYKFSGKSINAMGVMQNTYSMGIMCKGSIQAVDQALYEQLGLDAQKEYRQVWSSQKMIGLDKQATPDRLYFEDAYWNVVRDTPWHAMDGWCNVLVVKDK